MSSTFDICGLEVSPDTGAVRVDRYVTGHDAGRLLNPVLADGQIRGAFAQGLGAALPEEFRYGADGSFQSGTLADYLMPTTCEVPDPLIVHLETPCPFTPLGAKGLGEGNNMSTPVCIANAFADALKPLRDLAGTVAITATPEQVFAELLDPQALARVIPGCHALDADGPNRYRTDVTVGVGLVTARYQALIRLSEIDAPRSPRLAGSGTSPPGIGAGGLRAHANWKPH